MNLPSSSDIRKEAKFVSLYNLDTTPTNKSNCGPIFSNGKIQGHCIDVFNHDSKIVTPMHYNNNTTLSSLQIPTLVGNNDYNFENRPNKVVKFNGPKSTIHNRDNLNSLQKICSTILKSKLLHLAERGSSLAVPSLAADNNSCSNDSIDTITTHEMMKSITTSCSDVTDVSVSPKLKQCLAGTAKNTSDLCRTSTPPPAPRLTLSAFRRPEVTVRITDCEPSKCIGQKYRLYHNKVLGYGASSSVQLALRRTDGQRVAVKCIPKHVILRELKRLEEVALLRRLDHPNIVALHDVYENENEIQLVMECCEGGELYDSIQSSRSRNFLESYGEKSVAHIVKQLLSALEYLHSRGVVHRDVKPENILLLSKELPYKMEVKLSDFGLARVLHQADTTPCSPKPSRKRKLSDATYRSPVSCPVVRTAAYAAGTISIPLVPKLKRSRAYSRCGSDFYSAPEISSGVGYDTAVDIYSLGVTTYILLCGRYPPPPHAPTWNTTTDLFTEPQWNLASPQAKDFIRSMLHPDPCSRITAEEALEHSWLHVLTKEPKLDTITLDLDLLGNTTDLTDTDEIASEDEDDTSLPLRQYGLV